MKIIINHIIGGGGGGRRQPFPLIFTPPIAKFIQHHHELICSFIIIFDSTKLTMITKCERNESVEPLVPPVNFADVEDGVYRSGFPQPSNFAFLQTLHLRSIIYLCPEPYPKENLEFLEAHNIRLFQFAIAGTKELSVDVLRDIITETLKLLIDVRIHPVLIHCKQGKHRTGCVVGSLRKLQNWCLSSVLEEYKLYAGVKSRDTDLKFLETYDVSYLQQSLQTIIYQSQGYGSIKQRRLL